MKNLNLIILIIICLNFNLVNAQSWPKIFWDYYTHKTIRDLKEDYDKGYLLAGFKGWNNNPAEYAILTKTDINGNILWKKTFGQNSYGSAFYIICKTADKGCVLSGSTTKYENINYYKDPLFVKLNSCGEIEWCTVLESPKNNYATGVVPLEDGNYIGMLKYFGGDITNFRISLVKLNHEGHPLWIKHLAQEDSLIMNEEGDDLKVMSNGNYLVTGSCPYNGEKAYWIMTDTTGQQLWDIKWDLPGSGPSAAFETFESHNNMLYASGGMVKPRGGIPVPTLFKIDLKGNQHYYKHLLGDSITGGGAQSLCIYNDTTLLAGIMWRNTPGYDYGYSALLKTDTLGNLLDYRMLIDEYRGPEDIIKTFDNKILVAENYYVDGLWRIYLFKLNENLEDDTLYTLPFTYDSLCDHQITSDTTDLDCWLHVSIDDIPLKEDYDRRLEIWPNPAKEQINIKYQLNESGYQKETVLEIFDVYGKKVEEYLFPEQQSQISINTSSFHQGIYIAVVKRNKQILDVGRFVIAN